MDAVAGLSVLELSMVISAQRLEVAGDVHFNFEVWPLGGEAGGFAVREQARAGMGMEGAGVCVWG